MIDIKNLMEEEAYDLCILQWKELAKPPEIFKIDAINKIFKSKNIPVRMTETIWIDGACFLCEWAKQQKVTCTKCPMVWPQGTCGKNENALYKKWRTLMHEARTIALEISNLPRREKANDKC